jgi:light-regulated signal transduction histidine kinase (bacteriophytochrome)
MSAILEDLGVSLTTARSGEEALKHVLRQDFALILMDVMMPGMDGLETATLIRRRPKSSSTPLIFVTASSPEDTRVFRGYSLGAVDYIFKPIVPEILRSKVGVFVDLLKKTEQLKQQSEELIAMKSLEHQRELEETKQRLEAQYMRVALERERRSAQSLKQLTQELERSNRELEQFAYAASHDLKEPLRTVSSYLHLIERRYKAKLDDDGRDFIAFATDGARRMAQLVDDLLIFSRAGRDGMEQEEVDCNELVDRVITGLHAAIEETGAEIVKASLPTVSANRSQLSQLLQNLVSNAIKYRGKIRPRVEIDAETIDGEWRFTVRDNGIGFEMKYAERIFVIFQRLHGRDEYGGTGVGLAICKKIIERHGGRIWAESVLGEGSSFHFTLPAGGESLLPPRAYEASLH